MITLSADQFKQKYGDHGVSLFTGGQAPAAQPAPNQSIPTQITKGIADSNPMDAFAATKSAVQKTVGGFKQTQEAAKTGDWSLMGRGILNEVGGGLETVFSPVTNVLQTGAKLPVISQGVSALKKYVIQPPADFISNHKALQEFMTKYPHADEVAGNLLTIGLSLAGGEKAPEIKAAGSEAATAVADTAGAIKQGVSDTAGAIKDATIKPVVGVAKGVKNAAGEIIPSSDQIVSHNVTRALDLTQGDARNISQSTGNEVGKFAADNNLIGKNKAETVQNFKNFSDTNYKAVRAEIGKVTKTYSPTEIPRYQEALQSIKQKITDVPGLQKANAEVDALAKIENPTLNDVQRVKELMDEHFNLYKITGDVGEGVAKSGLANIRKDLRSFIEDQVQKETGADIRQMNNNVQTSKSVLGAVAARSTRGLTRANLSLSDIGTFVGGSAVGSPITGFGLVILKKIMQNPSVQLRIAKWLDGMSDVARTKVLTDMQNGVVPKDLPGVK